MKKLPFFINKGLQEGRGRLHDRIVDELLDGKPLSALIWLVERGREIELTLRGEMYFISRCSSSKFVSFWHGKEEQSFDSVEELLVGAKVADGTPFTLWDEIEIETIF